MRSLLQSVVRILRLFAAVSGAALVMAAWSELIFFNEGVAQQLLRDMARHPRDMAGFIAEIAVFYAIPSLFLIGLMGLFGSQGAARMLILGALAGYSIEGAVVPAVYEAVPFSYLWTSVAWHGPVTVALGIFFVPRLLSHASAVKMVAVCLVLGLAWGFWMPWSWDAEGMLPVPATEFQDFAAITTVIMCVGYGLLLISGWPSATIPSWLSLVFVAPSLVFFVIQGLAAPLAAVGLLAIIAGLIALLYWLGPAHEPSLRYDWKNFVCLSLIPLAASVAYLVFLENGTLLAAEDLMALALLTGLTVWILGVAHGIWQRWRVQCFRK